LPENAVDGAAWQIIFGMRQDHAAFAFAQFVVAATHADDDETICKQATHEFTTVHGDRNARRELGVYTILHNDIAGAIHVNNGVVCSRVGR